MAAGDPKLLVIDDNPNDLEALRVLVEKAIPGCGLWTAHSGPEGLKLAGAVDPDVMLLDMFMPGMDGIEVIRNLKADEHLRAIPVVFLTSRRTSQEARLRAVHAGGDGLLPKRPNEQELIAEVRAMRKLKAANLGDQRKEGRQASRARGQTRRPRELPAAPMREEMRLRHREEERLRAQSARLKMLVDASRAFAAAGHDYLAVLDQLVRRVCRAFADSSQVRLLSADGQWLELAALHSRDPEATEALRALEGQPLERVDGSRTESRVFRSGKPALFPVITLEQLKASNPPERWPLYERFPPHSAMVVPMRVRGRCIGAMGVTRYRSELPSFTRDDLALAQDLADRAALAVSHARLVRQLPAELAERTCAEEELQRALALLNETQHITRAGGWEYDVRTRRVRWTEEVYRIHGVSGDYDPSSPTKDILFYAPDDQAAITAAFQRAVEKGESYDLELQLRTAQGDQIWVQTIGHAERSEGRIVRVYGTIVAITERKQAQLALRESEMRYRALVEQAGDAFFVHDFEGRFTEVNQRACDSLGYSRQELLQMGVLDVEQDFDLKSAQAEWARIQPGVPFTLHGHQRRKDGSVIPVEVRFGCFVWGGRRLFLGLARDITEREQARQALLESNQRFSLLFEKAAFAVSLSRLPDGVLVDVNEAFEKAFGFTRQEALGRTILELGIIPDAADRARIINELEKHGMVRDQEQLLRTKSAEQRTFSVNIHSVQIAGQQYLLNTALDIADRKRAEEALREERRRLNHVLATAPGAICSFRQHSDGSSDFPYANSSIQDIYGLEPQDLARDASIIRQLIHPDDLARVREAILNPRARCLPGARNTASTIRARGRCGSKVTSCRSGNRMAARSGTESSRISPSASGPNRSSTQSRGCFPAPSTPDLPGGRSPGSRTGSSLTPTKRSVECSNSAAMR
jgi:PAS domain S-box-containing protein